MIINILIGIVAIIALLLIIALFVKKENSIRKDIVINRPNQAVYDYVKFLKNGEQYNKWVMTDPSMKKELKGVDGNEGFIYVWDSKNNQVGAGEQEIKKLVNGELIVYEIRFVRPFAGIAHSYLKLTSISPNETKVEWAFDSKMPYPMNIMRLFINFEDVLGKDVQTSLINLKHQMEK